MEMITVFLISSSPTNDLAYTNNAYVSNSANQLVANMSGVNYVKIGGIVLVVE